MEDDIRRLNVSVREFLWGDTKCYEVADIEEAVEMAQQFKADGQYDWFRGQVLDWPPHSSLHRVYATGDASKSERAERRLHLFVQWAQHIPQLGYLLEPEHVHDFFAILQHYGVPTHYVDFTTDPAVAGFFAADTRSPPSEGRSCIYCLDTQNLRDTWEDVKQFRQPHGGEIDLVTIDVRNLWRLQAQRGTFLYATYNWDVDYPMDRIVFPYSGYPAYPTRERIYPEHSPVEELLDRYFALERAVDTREEMFRLFEQGRGSGCDAGIVDWEEWSSGYYPTAFVDTEQMVTLESWRTEALHTWDADPDEDFFETVGATLRLKLKPVVDTEELRRTASFGVRQILLSEPDVRSRAVDWVFSDLPDQVSPERLNRLFRLTWNGMRRLPYPHAEIADALGSILALLVTNFARTIEPGVNKECFSQCFGDAIEVGFSYHDGSGSRGYVARQSLRDALRPDIVDVLKPDYEEYASDLESLFRIIYNPSLMFEFDALRRAFAREIVPAQVVLERSPILFNPARLKTLGIP